MATAIVINGQTITRPGVYSQIKSGIKNPPIALSYGNVLVIDDGLGAGYGGGAGMSGALTTQPADGLYSFSTIQDFRDFIKGGPLWDVAEALFKPAGTDQRLINGVSTLYFMRAATTVNAAITKTFENGSLTINTLDEGLNANGVLSSGILSKGYGAKLVPGVRNPNAFIFKISVGTFTGLDSLNGNTPYDGLAAVQAKPTLLVQSPELSTIEALVKWLNQSYEFNQYFRVATSTITTTGVFETADIDTTYRLAVGGTETYTPEDFDKALVLAKNLDNAFFLATKFGANALDLNNFKILDFLDNSAKYEKTVFIGGEYDSSAFSTGATNSILTATTFDSDKVVVVHGGCKKVPRNGKGFRLKSQFYKAAAVLGRTCGLEPQTPITLKGIGIDGEVHQLDENEQEQALAAGLLYTYYDYELEKFVIGQGINTLQNNQFLVNEDGTSFSLAVKRISGQLNKELIVAAKKRFYGGENGPNRNSISPEDVKAWTEGFLSDRIATPINDNLITRYANVVVTVTQDNIFVNYEFAPNFEVSKMVFTGYMLEK